MREPSELNKSEKTDPSVEENRLVALAKFQKKGMENQISFTDIKKLYPLPPQNKHVASSYKKFGCKTMHAKCMLVSRTRFCVETAFNSKLIDFFKTISSSSYDAKNKTWSFSIQDHQTLVNGVKDLEIEIKLEPLPSYVVGIFKSLTSNVVIPEVNLESIDPVIREKLFPFQVTGVCFGISKHGRCLIADDMGLGKTIQALAIASYYKSDWPLLVVAPSSVRYAWREAFYKWLPSVDPQSINVLDTCKDPIGTSAVYIISYDLMTRMGNALTNKMFKIIIADESHMLKNYKAARTAAILPLLKKAKRAILLSGTPALSRPSELYTQVSAVNPKFFHSFAQFGMRYCGGEMSKFGWNYSGSSNTTELLLLLEELVMIRRMKTDVLKQLPAKRREMVILDPTNISNRCKAMKEAASNFINTDVTGMEKRGLLLEYYTETAKAKIPAACAYITDLIEGERKFICFAHHKIIMDEIGSALDRKKCKYIRIDGSTSSEARKQLCDKFQLSNDYRVALLSITAACTGLTLTAAQLVVFAELFWNPGILTQAEDRAHRIGQADSVLVQYLVAKGTADDYLWPLVQRKLEVLNKAGLSKDNFKDADMITSQLTDIFQPTIDTFFDAVDDDYSWLQEVDWDNRDLEEFDEPSPKKIKSLSSIQN